MNAQTKTPIEYTPTGCIRTSKGIVIGGAWTPPPRDPGYSHDVVQLALLLHSKRKTNRVGGHMRAGNDSQWQDTRPMRLAPLRHSTAPKPSRVRLARSLAREVVPVLAVVLVLALIGLVRSL